MAKSNDLQNRLEAARGDLAAAQLKFDSVLAGEAAAVTSSETFGTWRSDRDAAAVEMDRLERLVTSIEAELGDEQRREATETRRKRVAEVKKRNTALAARIVRVGGEVTEALTSLMRDIATADVDDKELNAVRGEDDEFVVGAEFLARGRLGIPRKDVKEEILSLWCYQVSGNLVGDQDSVTETAPRVGFLGNPAGFYQMCVRRKYAARTFYPAEQPQDPIPLSTLLQLPDFAGPGTVWNGSRIFPQEVLQKLEQLPAGSQKSKRIQQTELEPIEPIPEIPPTPMQETLAKIRRDRAANR
ncbi:hypothetical protein [Bradyrhizobium sp. JYMT SZCCT0428]|uniref:hypothetical protein n=1 Tax=Bradyrhizobium sp. JYMT SZCCT0428 TaxID=2807673 RepID=UPI001BA7BED7|nr:hypothetical protein [Bradyrhizobium sp. JYMT SZCCT0428]MBR1154602.1 hypothetical protein [Bradyrhizobium sp. JYMT SZCCT0428]